MAKVYLSQRTKDAAMIRENMVLLQGSLSDADMCMKIGARSPQTWRSRKKNPETLTLGEIKTLCAKFHVDPVAFMTKPLSVA